MNISGTHTNMAILILIGSLGHSSKSKEEKYEERINKKSIKILPLIACKNDERKEEVTSVSLST